MRHEGALTRLPFGYMAAALPRMVGMVVRTGWEADPRALAGVVVSQIGQGVTAAWGLVAVNSVLARLFAGGPTAEKLRDVLPSLTVLAALLSAWSTAMSGRLEPQVERAVSARYYTAVTRVEVEATERPEIQRTLEAGKFGTDSARNMLRLSVGVGNVLIGMVAAAVVLASLHWVDHRRAIASLLAYLTRPHAGGEIRVHAAGDKLLTSYEEMSHLMEAEQQRLARAQASTDLVAGAFAGVASLACYGVLWWLLAGGGLPLAVGGTAVIAIRTSTGGLTALIQQVNRLYEELLFLTDTETAIELATEHAIPATGTPLPPSVDPAQRRACHRLRLRRHAGRRRLEDEPPHRPRNRRPPLVGRRHPAARRPTHPRPQPRADRHPHHHHCPRPGTLRRPQATSRTFLARSGGALTACPHSGSALLPGSGLFKLSSETEEDVFTSASGGELDAYGESGRGSPGSSPTDFRRFPTVGVRSSTPWPSCPTARTRRVS
ncbi:hypothetical protein AB0C59_33325 [Streptomyces sp. NPDC048664]|uniref:hypothetical protein n=1 Tax=Streptomyces sp. NPDC048664 TaxID=3154505 RepID=UPI00344660C3